MIFRRALLRECTGWAVYVFTALLAITVTTHLIRFLGQAASGRISSQAVVALLGFSAISYLPVLLSLTLFIAIVMSLSRAYRDSEMTIWFSAGLSLTAWIRAAALFAAPLVVTIAVLSLYLSPWSATKSSQYREMLDREEEWSRIMPGTFRESSNSRRVYFVEDTAGVPGSVQRIFINSTQHRRLGVMVSNQGTEQRLPNGDRYLVLRNGHRYEGESGSGEYSIMGFEKYAILVESRGEASAERSPKSMPTQDLLRSREHNAHGELLWRISMPIAAALLVVVAVPLAYVNPRAGRSSNLLLAVLTYMVYNNLISVSQAWVAQGKLSFGAGLAGVHLLMLVITWYGFRHRMRQGVRR